jgi:hypothetical protein
MKIVSSQPISVRRRSVVLDAGRRTIERLRALPQVTAQQRAERYVARMPVAILAG